MSSEPSDVSTITVLAAPTGSTAEVVAAQPQVLFVDDGVGPKGDPGSNVELRPTPTEIQWRVAGTTNWASLVTFADLASTGAAPQVLPGVATSVAYGQNPGVDVVQIGPGQFRLDITVPSGKPGQPRFTGVGPPPDLIVGAEPGDTYLDTSTGETFALT